MDQGERMPWWKWISRQHEAAGPEVSRYRPADGVSAASRDGRTVLLDMGAERYMGLDEVGSDIWLHLAERRSVPEIAACLAIEYAAPADRLETDVRRFMT
ncbi:MAG: PqqD family protein, partial [Gemmatimonadota bacterium]